MIGNLQHCPTCATEFVAGARACSDCGGPLTAGPLPDVDANQLIAITSAAQTPSAPPDTLFATLPGQQADYVAQALTEAGIASRLDCDGIQQFNGPGQPHGGPLAVTLPVSVFVPGSQLTAVTEVVRSITRDGEIMNPATIGLETVDLEALAMAGEPVVDTPPPPPPDLSPPQAEGLGLRLWLLLLLAAVALFLMLGRS